MVKGIRPIEEIREIQLQRLIKSKIKIYTSKGSAQVTADYAMSKGVNVEIENYSFLYTVKVLD
jgi:adenine C2-methylase RlmN of 23S rRNA A2503 and tRNA A37